MRMNFDTKVRAEAYGLVWMLIAWLLTAWATYGNASICLCVSLIVAAFARRTWLIRKLYYK